MAVLFCTGAIAPSKSCSTGNLSAIHFFGASNLYVPVPLRHRPRSLENCTFLPDLFQHSLHMSTETDPFRLSVKNGSSKWWGTELFPITLRTAQSDSFPFADAEDIENSEASTEDFETFIRGCNPAEEDIVNFEATATNHDESAVPFELYLNRLQSDFEISDSEFQNTGSMQDNEDKMKKHAKRMCQIAEDWDEHWKRVGEAHIGSYATLLSLCWNCKTSLTSCYICCLCCMKTFCPECDIQFHLWNAFHQRQLLFNAELIKLRSRDFWDQNLSVVVERDVAVPCFIPPRCKSCRSHPACGITEEASVRNYVESGYWPGSPTRTCTLFTQTYMTHWFQTKHQIPSTAAMKYMEAARGAVFSVFLVADLG
ncbi:hypothetical protein OUZ56_017587 [Daphnia magna]|uniref:CxC3 like cysteine cluster domain-containing protein n=1 Tax=Daphnia magna TaxID=35525 RepID=A0ABR0AT63_9CRUS|nr:hypothetical protein OUZ56_017587 [Daphnia magna]